MARRSQTGTQMRAVCFSFIEDNGRKSLEESKAECGFRIAA
jgi:hypothetical protein